MNSKTTNTQSEPTSATICADCDTTIHEEHDIFVVYSNERGTSFVCPECAKKYGLNCL